MTAVVHTDKLCKRFGAGFAVKNLDLHIEPGSIFGLLGPNGAGKTTTLLMLLGLERPTSGKVLLFGKTLAEAYFDLKRCIGVVAETPRVYLDMTALEYLTFFGRLYGLKGPRDRAGCQLQAMRLYERKDDRLRHFSRGMLQEIELARALLHEPQLLILDEPVSGLDPYGLKKVRDLLCEQRACGRAVLISSHILSEVEKTADRVGILYQGELVAEDDITAIIRRIQDSVEIEVELDEGEAPVEQALRKLDCVLSLEQAGRQLLVRTRIGADHRREIAQAISSAGGVILGLRIRTVSLEDAFVRITENNVGKLIEG